MTPRLLFASCHCSIDPSSGAALASRDLLELLAARGIDCRVLTPGVLDYEQEMPLERVLAPLGVDARPSSAAWTGIGANARVVRPRGRSRGMDPSGRAVRWQSRG